MSTDLRRRRILVTGATSGIGESTARAIVDAGGSVALVARSADKVTALAERLGATAVPVPADVTDAQAIALAADTAADALGGLDGVVCSAGLVRSGGISDSGPDDWRAMFDVNVLGLLQTVKAALPHLREAGTGDVINISSMSGRRRASVALGFYAASKFAVHVISDNLREELSPHGIRVSIISPGFVNTPIFEGIADEAERAQFREALETKGLDPGAVAAQVVHALRQPPGVDLLEIAMLSMDQ